MALLPRSRSSLSTRANGMLALHPTKKISLMIIVLLSYRMRLINMACDPHFIFQIDGHAMKIIEVDGINHKPLTVDSIDILAGMHLVARTIGCIRY